MLLSSVNRAMDLLLMRQVRNVFKDEELRLYFCIVAKTNPDATLNLRGFYEELKRPYATQPSRYPVSSQRLAMPPAGF